MPNSVSTAPETIVIDTRGQVCPSTLLVALQQLNTHREAIKSGRTILRLLTDNRHATVTIPGTVQNMGYDVSITKEGSSYEILIGHHLTPPEEP